MKPSRIQRRIMEKSRSKRSVNFIEVPHDQWPRNSGGRRTKVWLSRDFLCQLFDEAGDVKRLTISSTSHNGESWDDSITWDQLQEIKSLLGFGDCCAVEVFPEDGNVVNVANMRHLWMLPQRPGFAWRRS